MKPFDFQKNPAGSSQNLSNTTPQESDSNNPDPSLVEELSASTSTPTPTNNPSTDDISSTLDIPASSSSSVPPAGNQQAIGDNWSIWFYSKYSSWGPQLRPLYIVSTMEDFENRLSGMVKPSSVKAKAQLFVMRRGILPDRLDKRNSLGGCWALFIPVDYPNGKELLDSLWYKLCRAIVAGKFPHDDVICGAGVVMRNTQQDYPIRLDEHGETRFDPTQLNRDRIELWTWEASRSQVQIEIGQFMKALLEVPDLSLNYRNHNEVMNKRGEETIIYTVD
eukprot:TRINITY_DN3616_c1_g1_i5.p2 TRINITY_DN3616_c1_g1~~TRINITY_DN3616_c1_g1_i5.p2  ORF type:complete len:278 (-),score=48.32 TRINITY_DN3616_c1_g1_i5:1374-2207(-)